MRCNQRRSENSVTKARSRKLWNSKLTESSVTKAKARAGQSVTAFMDPGHCNTTARFFVRSLFFSSTGKSAKRLLVLSCYFFQTEKQKMLYIIGTTSDTSRMRANDVFLFATENRFPDPVDNDTRGTIMWIDLIQCWWWCSYTVREFRIFCWYWYVQLGDESTLHKLFCFLLLRHSACVRYYSG